MPFALSPRARAPRLARRGSSQLPDVDRSAPTPGARSMASARATLAAWLAGACAGLLLAAGGAAAQSGTCTNLVTNPSFETDLTGWKSSATLSRVSGGSVGSYSCLVTGPASTSSFYIEDSPRSVSSPVAGTTYHFAASVRSGASTGKVMIRIIEYVNGTKVGQLDSPAVTLSPSWQRLQVDYTALGTGSNLYFTVRDSPAAASEAFNVDDMLACSGSAPPPNQAPNGTIDTPTANVTITAGQSVSFTGTGSDPDNNTPLTFAWDFGGGATNSTVEDPGVVTFATAGTYTVTFTVKDALGLADPTPDTRTITVNPVAGNQAPNGTIDTPTANVTITAGQSVSFTGTGSDPDNNTPLTFAWNFGGGATNSTVEDPGAVTFATAGTYTVTFTVRDALGLADPTPDTRTITVNPQVSGGGGNVAVYVGYYDTHHSSHINPKPSPWKGSSGVTFVGVADDSQGNWDSSCLRIDNLTAADMTGVVVTCDIGSHHYALWGTRTIPANGKLLLAQTSFQNFDGSDTSPAGCYGCDPKLCLTKVVSTIPVIHVAVGGSTTNYYDNSQVLNTKGADGAGCPDTGGTRNDESHQWSQIGTTSAIVEGDPGSDSWAPDAFTFDAPAPNPVRDWMVLRFSLPMASHVVVAFYDVAGRLVRTQLDRDMPAGIFQQGVTLSGVNPGVYYCRVQTNFGALQRPVVVSR